jgi:hypothetical protein
MMPATPSEPRVGNGDIAGMLNTPHSRSRRTVDHSHRVAVVRETPRPVAALGSAW